MRYLIKILLPEHDVANMLRELVRARVDTADRWESAVAPLHCETVDHAAL